MAVICLTSASGSPGVTTTAVGLALCWPRPVLLVEVVAHGVPQSLKDAMVKASAIVGWDGWIGPGPMPADLRIDPAPHFANP